MNMERRKKPLVGDVVRIAFIDTDNSEAEYRGWVTGTVGIHLWIQLFALPHEGHSGREYIRRDSVDVISRARQ